MKIELKNRFGRLAQLPAVLLALALSAGFASVGHAEDIPSSMVITAKRPTHCDSALTLRNRIQETARLAVWKTRVSVASDLGLKLNSRQPGYRVAGEFADKRG